MTDYVKKDPTMNMCLHGWARSDELKL